jgi:hypothetical protein
MKLLYATMDWCSIGMYLLSLDICTEFGESSGNRKFSITWELDIEWAVVEECAFTRACLAQEISGYSCARPSNKMADYVVQTTYEAYNVALGNRCSSVERVTGTWHMTTKRLENTGKAKPA